MRNWIYLTNICNVPLSACMCRLEIVFTGKTIGIVAKSSKTLGDALSSVLQKHQLRPQDAVITVVCCESFLNSALFEAYLLSLRLAVAVRNSRLLSNFLGCLITTSCLSVRVDQKTNP